MYENASYNYNILTNEPSAIRVDINGVTSYVPIDPTNTDYQNIMKLVEEGKLVIETAEPVNSI